MRPAAHRTRGRKPIGGQQTLPQLPPLPVPEPYSVGGPVVMLVALLAAPPAPICMSACAVYREHDEPNHGDGAYGGAMSGGEASGDGVTGGDMGY
jgi:hypothetical protein